jgi:hypothetical protein
MPYGSTAAYSLTSDVWYTTTWANDTTTTSASSASSASNVWDDWNDMATTTTTSITWDGWNQTTTSMGTWTVWINGQLAQESQLAQGQLGQVWGNWQISTGATVSPESEEERAARFERERVWREREAERTAKAAEAEVRAKELLESMLTPKQLKQLAEKSEFEVVSQTGKRYAIAKGSAGNVHSLDERRRKVARHCIHPTDCVPCWDAMLSQLMWLRWNEAEFLKVANTTPLRLAA